MQITINTTGASRLIALYNLLTTIPDARVDLDQWCETSPYDEKMRVEGCGTKACVVGWACCTPEFQAMGLGWYLGGPAINGASGGLTGWDAVEKFFEIEEHTALHLFANEDNHTVQAEKLDLTRYLDNDQALLLPERRQVLQRIRNFLMSCQVLSVPEYEDMQKAEVAL